MMQPLEDLILHVALDGETVEATRTIEIELAKPVEVLFRAREIRKEKTGKHAYIEVEANGRLQQYTTMNTDRAEDRIRFANRITKRAQWSNDLVHAGYPKECFEDDFDQFCHGIWSAYIDATMPGEVPGMDLEIQFVIEPYVVQGGGTIIFAPPGRGKSYTGQVMAVCVDAGLDTLWPVQQTRALYLNLERSEESLQRRLAFVNGALGLESDRPLLMMNARGKSLWEIAETVQQAVRQMGIGFLVLDSISRTGYGDLTEGGPATKIGNTLNSLGPSWLALGHTPRATEEHVYGSIMFEAVADVVVKLTTERADTSLAIGLEVVKANDIGRSSSTILEYEFSGYRLSSVGLGRLEDHPAIAGRLQPDRKAEIEEHLLDVGARSATEISKDLGMDRSQAAKILADKGAFVIAETEGRTVRYMPRSYRREND